MKLLPSGAIQANHGELITLDIRSTGAVTNFGVVYSMTGDHGSIPEGAPFQITLDWNKATGPSDIPDARTNNLILTFSFTSAAGGKYDYSLAGEAGGAPPLKKRATQAGALPTVNDFIFHILKPA